MSKPKIMLFFPKPTRLAKNIIPLSLLAIARMINTQKYDVKLVNATTDHNYKKKIVRYGREAICVGISCLTGTQIHDALDVATLIKQEYPSTPIIWGGWHPSLLPEQTVLHPCVDIVVKGQGERTFKQVVYHLSNELPLDNIKGIAYKKNDSVFNNPNRAFEDINNFPRMPYSMIDVEKYVSKYKYGSRCISYVSSQGCPHACGFCCEPIVCGRQWFGLNAKRVVDELEYLHNSYAIDTFKIGDSNFFVSKTRVKDICMRIIKRKLDINLVSVNGRVELGRWNDDMWNLMRKAGVRELLVGAESGFQQVLDLIGKNVTVKDTMVCTKKCVKHDIAIRLSFMIGLPTVNTRIETEKTIQLIDNIWRIHEDATFLLFFYTPYPNSRLYEISVNCGFSPPRTLDGWQNFGLHDFKANWVPKKYARLVRQFNLAIFPYITSNVDFNKTNILKRVATKFLEKVARFRWEHKFFGLPIEYKIIKHHLMSKKPLRQTK